VLFPGGVLPLHVFEERYRQLVREGRDFGVVLIRTGSEVGPGRGEDIHRVGTLATLEEVQALPDGRYHVLARGLSRFRVADLDRSRPYLMARVEPLPEPAPEARPRLLHLLDRYLEAHGVQVAPQLSTELGKRAVWMVGSVLQAEPGKRQQLLESGDPEIAEALLSSELAKLESLGRLGAVPRRPPSRN
jgi:Lon protease-like protein